MVYPITCKVFFQSACPFLKWFPTESTQCFCATQRLACQVITAYQHQQMRPSAKRSEVIILSSTVPVPGGISQRKHYKTLFGLGTRCARPVRSAQGTALTEDRKRYDWL